MAQHIWGIGYSLPRSLKASIFPTRRMISHCEIWHEISLMLRKYGISAVLVKSHLAYYKWPRKAHCSFHEDGLVALSPLRHCVAIWRNEIT